MRKPDRKITIYIEELIERLIEIGQPQATEVQVAHVVKRNIGGEYEVLESRDVDSISALTSAAAMALANSDDLAEEVMENVVAFCNTVIQQVVTARNLDPDDCPEVTKDFNEVPEELKKQVELLAPVTLGWRNRH